MTDMIKWIANQTNLITVIGTCFDFDFDAGTPINVFNISNCLITGKLFFMKIRIKALIKISIISRR